MLTIEPVAQRFVPRDPPAEFALLGPFQQRALRVWVQLALEPTRTWRTANFNHSYSLKHEAEDCLGTYISNGALKGAMALAGYEWQPDDPHAYRHSPHQLLHNPNWRFKCQRRCPHGCDRSHTFICPARAYEQRQRNTAPYPTICQATPAELEEFLHLRALAQLETEVEHSAPSA